MKAKRLYNTIFTTPNRAYDRLPDLCRWVVFLAIVMPIALFVPTNIQILVLFALISFRHQAFTNLLKQGGL
ncbi:hypothetical protein LCGC14_2331600 [marine sediment metagenome]|uniref:Uncharacterized protein n=1 Tax=marine sediment metagenome TaxID=412755 RepID=A0A0F9CFF9_9ZZZZ